MKRVLSIEVPSECSACSDDSVKTCLFKVLIKEKQTETNSQCFAAMGAMATKALESKVEKEPNERI